MNAVLLDLRTDHHHMVRVMKLMRYAVKPLQDNQSAEHLELLEECVEYMTSFPDTIHHKTEDVIFERLVQRDSTAHIYTDKLHQEHIQLARAGGELAALVHALEHEHILSLQKLAALADEYINLQTRHMRLEEVAVFPLVDQSLDISDWKQIIKDAPARKNPTGLIHGTRLDHLISRYNEVIS